MTLEIAIISPRKRNYIVIIPYICKITTNFMVLRIEGLKRKAVTAHDGKTYYKCSECDGYKLIDNYELKSYTNKKDETYLIPRSQCKECRNYESKIYHRTARKKLEKSVAISQANKWYKDRQDTDFKLKTYLLARAKFSAKSHNREFNLTIDDILIPKKCPILNKPFIMGDIKYTYSVDRIDNSKDYIKGNIRIISRLANMMKNSATNEELLQFSKNIKNYIKEIV